jgi:uncharacterized protein (TIGR02611 family)
LRRKTRRTSTLRTARRVFVALTGGIVTLVGLAMLVLPGPAIVVIPIGLAILAVEFDWAKQWLRRLKEKAAEVVRATKLQPKDKKAGSQPSPSAQDDKER